uniref:CSON007116 protein n=1 Tax=Culicoides sonorensis TaxID=179676 RepID=A0A336MU77_CULSO
MYHQPAFNLDQNRIAHTNMVVSYDTYPQTNPSFPIYPPVKLKKLAFYDTLGELIKPSTLIPNNNHQRNQEKTFQFTLSPQQATDLATNRDIRNLNKIEYVIQVQLRFCQLDTTQEQEDCFPSNVVVKVNNKVCQLPNPIPTNKPGVEPKRPPRPVNVTQNVKLSPTVTNCITVNWVVEYNKTFCVAAYLVKKLSSSQLLERLQIKGIKPAEHTRGIIRDKLRADADCDIATTMLKVSLCCPLGKMRMTNPCRASTCNHLQCFDASLYLQMNERKPTWNCPVCDKPAIYDNLVIDGYFTEVLASSELPSDKNEIELLEDGSWSVHIEEKKEDKVKEKKVQRTETAADDIMILDDDDDDDVPPSKSSTVNQSPVKTQTPAGQMSPAVQSTVSASFASPGALSALSPPPTSASNSVTVDLTLSDSDDDQQSAANQRQSLHTPQLQQQQQPVQSHQIHQPIPQISPAALNTSPYLRQQSLPVIHSNGTSPSLSAASSRPASVGGGKPNDAETVTSQTIEQEMNQERLNELQLNAREHYTELSKEHSTSKMDFS